MTAWHNRPVSLLFSWGRWVRLRHVGLRVVNIYAPVGGFLAAATVLFLVPGWTVAREFGIVHQVNGLLQILAAFFIAALALVAGFPTDALDRPMGAVRPKIVLGDGDEIEPSRREFFGILFSYLSALSVILYGVGALAMSLASSDGAAVAYLRTAGDGWPMFALKAAYVAALGHFLAVTFFSLHFLGGFLSSSRVPRVQPPSAPPPANTAPRQTRVIRRAG
jgi:hypothetical protein